MTPIDFEDWLTAHVRPIAFRDVSLWRSRQEDAQRICAEIGRQLIDKYVIDGAKTWRKPVQDGFALGGAGFGGVMVFGHSIPKICLPLFWLGGPVMLDRKHVDWKPLFYDARRTGKSWS